MSVSSALAALRLGCRSFKQARPAPATRQAMHSCARDSAEPTGGENLMIRTRLAIAMATLLVAGAAHAQQQPPAAAPPPPPDFSKVEIKTTDLGDNMFMLDGQGGNITVAVAKTGIIMVDGQYAPLHDKIKAAIATLSNQPIKYLINTHYHGDHTGGEYGVSQSGAPLGCAIT